MLLILNVSIFVNARKWSAYGRSCVKDRHNYDA